MNDTAPTVDQWNLAAVEVTPNTVTTQKPVETYRYTYSGNSQYAVLTTSNALLSSTMSVPGGAFVTIPASGTPVWSYPNLHGDSIVTAGNTGVRTGQVCSYDPLGQPVDPVTGNLGTGTADDAVSDTQPGEADHGWVGSNGERFEHQGTIATIGMGARFYVPALGRFLQVDSIRGGNGNDYAYPTDPINGYDLTGQREWEPAIVYHGTGTDLGLGTSRVTRASSPAHVSGKAAQSRSTKTAATAQKTDPMKRLKILRARESAI